ncbi:MAG TPA: hypothetical protein VF310_03595, partial [Vicinamibacteria bacterium]
VGAPLAVGVPRDLRVTGLGLEGQGGSAAGCQVPATATVALLNLVAVSPTGPGNLRAWAYANPPEPAPLASILNYASVPGAGLNLANAVAVPVCQAGSSLCPNDINVQADVSGAHVVVDALGYFRNFTIGGANLLYTPLTPCRIADTRVGAPLAVGVPRDLRVTGLGLEGQGGSAAGCQVPATATVALLNLVAVNPTGPGNLRAWAPPAAPPQASALNYAAVPGAGLNLANALPVAICTFGVCPAELRIQADGSATHVVVDVLGYFAPAGFGGGLTLTPSP